MIKPLGFTDIILSSSPMLAIIGVIAKESFNSAFLDTKFTNESLKDKDIRFVKLRTYLFLII